MIRAILLDADGVTIKKHGYFSERLSKEYNIPLEQIMPFFKKEYGFCAVGEADLKEEIAKYLPRWGIQKPIDELLQWWFEGENQKNEGVLKVVEDLRSEDIKAYLTTDQEKYRANYILNDMEFYKYFDGTFFSCNLGHKKSEKEFFEKVLSKIEEKSENVMYWDDDEKNVQVAKSLGINAETFASFDEFIQKMKEVNSV